MLALMSFVFVASVQSVPHGLRSGQYGDVVAHSDYTLNLQPPEEDAHTVEASLDAIMKDEDAKRKLSDIEFEEAKQQMVNEEKHRIGDIIQNALKPLLATSP